MTGPVLYAASNPACIAVRTAALQAGQIPCVTACDRDSLERALRTVRPVAVLLDLPITGLNATQLPDLLRGGPPALVCGAAERAAAVPPPHRFLAHGVGDEAWLSAVRELLAGERLSLQFDAVTGLVTWNGHSVRLSPIEAQLLGLLLAENGSVVSMPAIVRDLWGYEADAAAATLVRAHIYQLRRALAEIGIGSIIETLPRRGYRLTLR